MKFTVTFKTPYAVHDAIDEEVGMAIPDGLTDEQTDDFVIKMTNKLTEFSKKFVRYGELIDVEFDTDTGTVKVLPSNQR